MPEVYGSTRVGPCPSRARWSAAWVSAFGSCTVLPPTRSLGTARGRGVGGGVRREHAVAVAQDAGEAAGAAPLVERDASLALDRLGDRPLVVLAEEDHRGVVAGGEDERLVDVALRRRAV